MHVLGEGPKEVLVVLSHVIALVGLVELVLHAGLP
jgi:hypothetical protein